MNVKFLSPALTGELKQAGFADCPQFGVRFSQSFAGHSGEGFLFLYDRQIVLADKEFGQANFKIICLDLSQTRCTVIKDEGKALEFHLTTPVGEYPLAVSFVEYDDAKAILAALPDAPEAEAKPQAVLFTAGLIYAATADDSDSPDREKILQNMALPATLAPAREYCAKHSLDEYAYAVNATFSPAQKISLLANLLEFEMADLTLHSAETKFFYHVGDLLHLDHDKCRTIYQILFDKNNVGQLFCS